MLTLAIYCIEMQTYLSTALVYRQKTVVLGCGDMLLNDWKLNQHSFPEVVETSQPVMNISQMTADESGAH